MIILISIGLIVVTAGFLVKTGFFAGVSIRNPAFGGFAVEELPLIVDIQPENMQVDEETQNKISISLYNPKDYDITKNLVLMYRYSQWNITTMTWSSFSGWTELITIPDVTIHPKDTVRFDIPFMLKAEEVNDENVEGHKRLYLFKLTTKRITETQSLDFTAITSPSSTHIARYDKDDDTLENDPTIGTEFTTTKYNAISMSDNVRASTRAVHEYDYAQQIFGFKIGVPENSIHDFTINWEGYITYMEHWDPRDEKMLIWNYGDNEWEFVSSSFNVFEEDDLGATDGVVSKTYTANIGDYIDGGYLYVMVYAKNSMYGNVHTDYISLSLTFSTN